MKYRFIKNHEHEFPIEKMCEVLEVHSSSYYKWKARPASKRALMKDKIKQQITSIYFASKQRYGSPRITAELNAMGYKISSRSEEHTSELQSRPHLVCRLLLEKKKTKQLLCSK